MLSRKNKKVCIIGSTPSMKDAPYGDKSWDIWAISGAVASESLGAQKVDVTPENKWNAVHRVDVFFEMHKPRYHPQCLGKLAVCGKPVVMLRQEKSIPTSIAYPIEEVADALGEEFSSSVAYMFALAIYLGYEEIRFYGIYLMHETEYLSQRPAFKYYLGVARAKGIKVWADEATHLTCPAWRYGYDDVDIICRYLEDRKASIEDQMNKQKQAVEDARQVFFQLRGAAQDCADNIAEIKGGLA